MEFYLYAHRISFDLELTLDRELLWLPGIIIVATRIIFFVRREWLTHGAENYSREEDANLIAHPPEPDEKIEGDEMRSIPSLLLRNELFQDADETLVQHVSAKFEVLSIIKGIFLSGASHSLNIY